MRKMLKRLAILLIILILLLAGGIWWLLSYIAPQQQLDLNYEPIDVKSKLMDMVKRMRPELVLTEADVNNLIKMALASADGRASGMPAGDAGASAPLPEALAGDIRITGASFELQGELLLAHINIMYKERIPAELQATYTLLWDSPTIILEPQSLAMKGISLPASMLDYVEIPLDLPSQDVLSVRDVRFEDRQIRILFKLQVQLP